MPQVGKGSGSEARRVVALCACTALSGCVAVLSSRGIAIAGDEPADFDELYSYLKSDDAALGLNEMFGAGWFLTPLPIE